MSLAAGTRLGAYEVVGLIGAGGMGEVYRARDTKLDRDVALKILPEAFVRDTDRLARFRREARALAALNHPRIAAIHGWEDGSGRPALVMEFVDGTPLASLIGRGGMPVAKAVGLAVQMAAGIEAAHRAGITHRDLKPSNVMVTVGGDVKLLDFGLARLMDAATAGATAETMPGSDLTDPGAIVGTVAYMSPEQAQGLTVDPRSDLFSFGVVLFELLTGRAPFRRENQAATLAAILREEPPAPSTVRGETLPSDLERIVLKCLRKDRERRFQTASDLRVALEDVREDLSSGHVVAKIGPGRRRRNRWAVWAPLAATSLALVAAAVWLRPESPSAANPLRKLTSEAGVALMPALSPDGKLLAYASDGGGEGELDLWVKQVAGGDAARVTAGLGGVSHPRFAPDGTKVYFLTHRNEIFEVSTLGGLARKIVESAGPFSVSPQGEIAFVQVGTGGGGNPIRIVPADGGTPEPWRPECAAITPPAWAPDAQRLAFVGRCNGETGLMLVPRGAGPPVKVPVADPPGRRGSNVPMDSMLLPSRLIGFVAWSPLGWFRATDGREGVVAAWREGDTVNIHQIFFDGSKQPLTLGTGWETYPTVSSSGHVAFMRAEMTPTVWSLPLGAALPVGERPRKEVAPANLFDVSEDGMHMVYARILGPDRGELRSRDMATGQETRLASHTTANWGVGSFWGVISPDGQKVVYRVSGLRHDFFVASTSGGLVRQVQGTAGLNLASDWFRTGSLVLGECLPTADGLCTLDTSSDTVARALRDPTGGELLYPSFAWDGRWVTLMRRRAGGTGVWIAPVLVGGGFGAERTWIEVSPPGRTASRSRFAPDGNALYYLLSDAGTLRLVRQELEPATKRPVGDPVRLTDIQVFPTTVSYSFGASASIVDVSRERVYFNTVDLRSNVWMTSVR